MTPSQAFVALIEIFEEGADIDCDPDEPPPPSKRLKEWWPILRLRPLPPRRPPGFAASLRKGCKV